MSHRIIFIRVSVTTINTEMATLMGESSKSDLLSCHVFNVYMLPMSDQPLGKECEYVLGNQKICSYHVKQYPSIGHRIIMNSRLIICCEK